MGPERYRRYFPHGGRVRREGQRIEIEAPSRFVADMLMRRFSDSIREAAEAALGETALQISVRVRAEREEGSASGDAPGRAVPTRAASSAEGAWGRPAEQAPKRRAVRRRERSRLRRLDDFVVGACNHLAHRAAMTLTEDACPPGFSPLFIHGACGLGKTHLLQGVTRRFLERRPEAKVRCVTGEEFTFGYVSALRSGKADAFRAAHRDLDLLCIDDVHFLSSKSATQQEFLHTFNAIGMDGARVALASDEHPSRLRSFSKELISRFLSGMVVELKPMDQETRLRFARQTAARRELRIDEAGLALVAARCEESAREIEGAVTRIAALHRLARGGEGVVGPDLVEEALGPDPDERPTRPIKMSLIAERVCSTLRVEPSELLGRSRHKRVVLARSLTAHLGRKLTTLSYPELAREMNRPNHSTVVTACQRVERALETHACCEAGVEFEGETYQSLIARLKREIVRASM
jgi:chromosomal replication initiator protein